MLQTIQKAGELLALFDREHADWGVREVAVKLKMAKSSTHDLMSSLAKLGLLHKTEENRYRLGWRLVTLSETLLATLRARGVRIAYVTLHVGAGTFQPVRVQDLAAHEMHGEWYDVPQSTVAEVDAARRGGGRVLAVGTTTLRALETAAASGRLASGSAETRLFVVPGFRFRVVERLLTNFHLPKSTLLMLVSAFGGMDNVRRAYRHAIEQSYRFYSYGDAMLIEKQ